jgi:hypothetical protein
VSVWPIAEPTEGQSRCRRNLTVPWLEQSRGGGSEREQVAPFRFLHRLRLPIALDPRRPQSDGALDCAGVSGNTVIDPMGQLKVVAPIIVRYATLRHATECHAT